jgi:hypothetical protein
MLNVKQQQYPNETKEKNNMARGNQRKVTPNQPTLGTERTYSGRPGVPKSRSDADSQSNVNKLYGWVKANWSKPILDPGALQEQRDFSDKQNKRPLKEQIFKKYN